MDTFGTQTKIISSLNKHFLRIAGVLIVLFVVAQFFILATLGTKGAEIARIRQEKADLREQNEYLRSEIDKAKTLAHIQLGLTETFELEGSNVNVIYEYSDTTSVSSTAGL
jgi:hypothetical protein